MCSVLFSTIIFLLLGSEWSLRGATFVLHCNPGLAPALASGSTGF